MPDDNIFQGLTSDWDDYENWSLLSVPDGDSNVILDGNISQTSITAPVVAPVVNRFEIKNGYYGQAGTEDLPILISSATNGILLRGRNTVNLKLTSDETTDLVVESPNLDNALTLSSGAGSFDRNLYVSLIRGKVTYKDSVQGIQTTMVGYSRYQATDVRLNVEGPGVGLVTSGNFFINGGVVTNSRGTIGDIELMGGQFIYDANDDAVGINNWRQFGGYGVVKTSGAGAFTILTLTQQGGVLDFIQDVRTKGIFNATILKPSILLYNPSVISFTTLTTPDPNETVNPTGGFF